MGVKLSQSIRAWWRRVTCDHCCKTKWTLFESNCRHGNLRMADSYRQQACVDCGQKFYQVFDWQRGEWR